jgi:hypothetical protein
VSTTRNIRTLDEARALVKAADLIQEEKHELGLQAGRCGDDGDFESRAAYLAASRSLQRVEDKLRAAAEPEAKACRNYQPIGTTEGPDGESVNMTDCYVCGSGPGAHR